MEEIIGDPVWKVEDRDLGMMDLGRDRVQEWYIIYTSMYRFVAHEKPKGTKTHFKYHQTVENQNPSS